MWRPILGVVAGAAAWVLIVSLLDRGLRMALPGYETAEPALAFTLPMMLARLAMAAVTSLAAGAAVRAVAPASRWAPGVLGVGLLALFLPEHLSIWSRLPVWYHLVFLVTLAPLVVLGAALRPPSGAGPAGSP